MSRISGRRPARNPAAILLILHPNSFDVAPVRDEEVNDLYAGKLVDPLTFLRERNISMVTIWADDHVDPGVVAKLRHQLAPDYVYEDCRGFKPAADAPEAGVFVFRDLVASGSPGGSTVALTVKSATAR